jgi:hypothetical protein
MVVKLVTFFMLLDHQWYYYLFTYFIFHWTYLTSFKCEDFPFWSCFVYLTSYYFNPYSLSPGPYLFRGILQKFSLAMFLFWVMGCRRSFVLVVTWWVTGSWNLNLCCILVESILFICLKIERKKKWTNGSANCRPWCQNNKCSIFKLWLVYWCGAVK